VGRPEDCSARNGERTVERYAMELENANIWLGSLAQTVMR
jgi:hypothetical protein